MAYSVYLTVVGKTQGAIKGPVTDTGRANTILVHAFDLQVTTPVDPATGLATGKRQHQPLTVLKEIDQTSPKLWTALINNEALTSCVLQFWAPAATPAGTQTQMYTITLTNAIIASIEESMLDNGAPANASLPLREEITFAYQKIEWTWTDGGITAVDNWQVTT